MPSRSWALRSVIVLCGGVLLGCTGPQSLRLAARVDAAGLRPVAMKGGAMPLFALARVADASAALRVYIEGDGYAWANRNQPSADPTPRQPIALELALLDRHPNLLYLARPCQYLSPPAKGCKPALWTSHRFSPEVIDMMEEALTGYAQAHEVRKLELVGYSGGAALAVLLAARRSDVLSLRTVAGNLDSEGINRLHRVSPMPGSLNPLDVARALTGLPQLHFVGGQDVVVPAGIARAFLERVGQGCGRWVEVPAVGHQDGWVEAWPGLLGQDPVCGQR